MYIELRSDKGLVQRKRASRPTLVSARLLAQPCGVDGDIQTSSKPVRTVWGLLKTDNVHRQTCHLPGSRALMTFAPRLTCDAPSQR